MKDTYFDQNRLMDETDRRFHATDLERVGGYVQVVPAVVERLAPLVTVGAWSFSELYPAGHRGDSRKRSATTTRSAICAGNAGGFDNGAEPTGCTG